MLKSRNVPIHILKGLIGFALLWTALESAASIGWWAILPGLAAVALFKGCPMCWTVGLIETVIDGRSTRCADGSCTGARNG